MVGRGPQYQGDPGPLSVDGLRRGRRGADLRLRPSRHEWQAHEVDQFDRRHHLGDAHPHDRHPAGRRSVRRGAELQQQARRARHAGDRQLLTGPFGGQVGVPRAGGLHGHGDLVHPRDAEAGPRHRGQQARLTLLIDLLTSGSGTSFARVGPFGHSICCLLHTLLYKSSTLEVLHKSVYQSVPIMGVQIEIRLKSMLTDTKLTWTIDDPEKMIDQAAPITGSDVQTESDKNHPVDGRFTRLPMTLLPQRLIDRVKGLLASRTEHTPDSELTDALSLLQDSVDQIGATVPFQPKRARTIEAIPFLDAQTKVRRSGKKKGTEYSSYSLNQEGNNIVDALAAAVNVSGVATKADYDKAVAQLASISQEMIAQLTSTDTTFAVQKLWIKRATETVRLRALKSLKAAEKSTSEKPLSHIEAEYMKAGLLKSLKIELDGSDESWDAYSTALKDLYLRGKGFHANECDESQPEHVARRKAKDANLRSIISIARNFGYQEHKLNKQTYSALSIVDSPVVEPQNVDAPTQPAVAEPSRLELRRREVTRRVRKERLQLAGTVLLALSAMGAINHIGATASVDKQDEFYTENVALAGASLDVEQIAEIGVEPSVEPSATSTATPEPSATPMRLRRYFSESQSADVALMPVSGETTAQGEQYQTIEPLKAPEKRKLAHIDYTTPGEVSIYIQGIGTLTVRGKDGQDHTARYVVADDTNLPKDLGSGISLFIKNTLRNVPIHIHHSIVGSIPEIAHALLGVVREDQDKDGQYDNAPKRLVGRKAQIAKNEAKGLVKEDYVIATADIIDARKKDANGRMVGISTLDMLNVPSIKALIDAGYTIEVHNTCYSFAFYLNSEGKKVWYTDKYLIMAFMRVNPDSDSQAGRPVRAIDGKDAAKKESAAKRWFKMGNDTQPWKAEMARKQQAMARGGGFRS